MRVNHVLTQSLMGINREPFKITARPAVSIMMRERASRRALTRILGCNAEPVASARFDASGIAFYGALAIHEDLISTKIP